MGLGRRNPADAPSVLIVDDDYDARRLYAAYLRIKGWTAFTAADGRSGIDKAMELVPSAIVLDLSMPRVDGWTVLEHLRESSWTQGIPVVVVSALEERDRALECGCDAYLSKPCDPEVVWLQVRALLRLQATARGAQV